MALLQKSADCPETYYKPAEWKKIKLADELNEFLDLVKMPVAPERIQMVEERAYLMPELINDYKNVRKLRAGLLLGEVKKNRFEPSHALALALSPGDAVHVWNLKSEEAAAAAYLNGQTFPAEGEKGWYLITVDGYSIGWGKQAGNLMKNHYPKGLRIPFSGV